MLLEGKVGVIYGRSLTSLERVAAKLPAGAGISEVDALDEDAVDPTPTRWWRPRGRSTCRSTCLSTCVIRHGRGRRRRVRCCTAGACVGCHLAAGQPTE
jgi:hypothetical protein